MGSSVCDKCTKDCYYRSKDREQCIIDRAHNVQLAKNFIDIDSLLKIKDDIDGWQEEIDKSVDNLMQAIDEVALLMKIDTNEEENYEINRQTSNLDVNNTIEYLSLNPNKKEDIATLNEIIDLCNRGYEWGKK
jgi:hypothetical protein